jgi:nucleotide-binding universal stress UspA family protein
MSVHDRILIPVALDHEAIVAPKIERARGLLRPGGRITLLTVLEAIPGFVAEFVTVRSENHLSARVKERLETAARGADDIDCMVTTGKPGHEIARVAGEIGADLVIVGARGAGEHDHRLGSTATRAVRRAPCSVYVWRAPAGG